MSNADLPHNLHGNLHDSYFRFVMQHLIAAQQFLDWFAPDFIINNIDLNSLTFVDTSYVNKSLKKTFSDVVFDCKYKATGKEAKWQAGKIVILIEHQSTPEKLLPIRVYNYIFNLLEKLRKSAKKKDTNKPLPVVYPIIFYNGKRKTYPYSTNLQTCLSGPAEAIDYYPNKDIQLINVNTIPKQETARHQIAGIMAEAMKRPSTADTPQNYVAVLKQIAQMASLLPEGFTKATIRYMMNVKHVDDLESLIEQAEQNQQLPDKVRGAVMTIAEAYEARGKAKAKAEGKTEVAINMLKAGMDIKTVAELTGLELTVIEELSKQILD